MKKYLKIHLTITLILALIFTFNASAFAVVEQTRTQKVDSLLLEYMDTADEDELIPINILLQPIDSDALRNC